MTMCWLVLHATVFDKACKRMVVILASFPAKVVDVTVKRVMVGQAGIGSQKVSRPLLYNKGMKAHAINHILRPTSFPAAQNRSVAKQSLRKRGN
jgi:hypothetical protein